MSQIAHVRSAVGKVTAALGTSLTFTRKEYVGDSPQGAFSLSLGVMATTGSGSMTVRGTPAPVDIAMLPEKLMHVELQRWRVAAADCTPFFPARGNVMTIDEGPAAGAKLTVRHVGRSASDAAIDVYVSAVGGSAGLPSSGEES